MCICCRSVTIIHPTLNSMQSYSFSVPENSVLDTSVFLVPAIDIDYNTQF